MPLDAIALSALKNDLSNVIIGSKIDRVQQPENDILLLSLRGPSFSGRLLVCAGNGTARVHLTQERFENPMQPPMFCMLMRKHIEGARITEITQPPMERLLDIKLDCTDALGDQHEKHLVLELMGRYSNVILTDDSFMIIDCLRRIGSAMSEGRIILPGMIYRMPEQQGRANIAESSDENIACIVKEASLDMTAEKLLLSAFMGFSPLVCREVAFRAYGQTDVRMFEVMARDGGAALVREIIALRELISSEKFVPVLLKNSADVPKDLSYMEIRQYEGKFVNEKLENFSVLLDSYYTRREKAEKARQRSMALLKNVKTLRDRLSRKIEAQKKELRQTADRETLRQTGDILMANIGTVPKGSVSFEAEDFYSETGGIRLIKLDPAKSAQQNAAKYYKDYTKAKNASKILGDQIAAGEKELEYLESVLEETERAESEKDISDIRRELEESGYIKKPRTGKKERKTEHEPMRFKSDSGYTIYVGRNNVQNDALTLKKAFKSDIWLHTQKIHGSHAVITANGETPDDNTIMQAACLAAYYSKARNSGKVPVDYTLVKYVKKPSGAKPGMVIYTDYKTVYVTPDEKLVKRLAVK